MKGKVLVTGATGFTGSHLCERLVSEGYYVRALVRDPNRCSDLHKWGVDVVVGDLRNPGSLVKATRGIDTVYHIAALFRQDVTRKEMWEINVHGTKNILDASLEEGVQRFVHCSTVGVHGDIKNPPADESTQYGPCDNYEESKLEGEKIVLRQMKAGGLPIVIFRPGGIYGPRDLRFLKLFKAIKTQRFIMLGSGEVSYQMIYIDDLIDGILLCGTKEQAIGNIYILTGEGYVTLNRLVELIAEVIGVQPPWLRFPVVPVYLAGFLCEVICKPLGINPPLYRRRVNFFRKTRVFDISKAKKELNFKPKTDLKKGLSLTAHWYREHNYL